MRDWKAIAQGSAPEIPGGTAERIAAILQPLEEILRPLFVELTPEDEPAGGFDPEDGAE